MKFHRHVAEEVTMSDSPKLQKSEVPATPVCACGKRHFNVVRAVDPATGKEIGPAYFMCGRLAPPAWQPKEDPKK